ncbi:hypothetical protein E2C01_003029 [Portunus trituberculatus]|uniref:Uncharacterized protein n=1 Tax=Portunus trituberculatus TaxID=210409 RepID=A0A5B7CMH4_PORTR|nr:hypothetical protein [Portunus trituberculatus]
MVKILSYNWSLNIRLAVTHENVVARILVTSVTALALSPIIKK